MNTQPTAKDLEDAKRIPEDWTALGAIGFPSSTAQRLLRLGLIERKLARPGLSRMWDYRRPKGPQTESLEAPRARLEPGSNRTSSPATPCGE